MRAFVEGEVLEVQVQEPYTNPASGKTTRTTRVFLRPENPRYAAEFYDTPSEFAPVQGELVRVLVSAQARLSRAGTAYLSVWASQPAVALASV